eukprot:TRINITY_DN9629_c0_g1_i1.p1 TRINITY_DN9629_c0_g1~~TRINITY_DN9629_c0_g1_i1.p1  ORF type:complete len:285 (+),score=40.15 TRINITY_DN9629_c0_g1_i1:313-1167(+)
MANSLSSNSSSSPSNFQSLTFAETANVRNTDIRSNSTYLGAIAKSLHEPMDDVVFDKQRKKRNRSAAKLSRQRHKQYVTDLEVEAESLKKRYTEILHSREDTNLMHQRELRKGIDRNSRLQQAIHTLATQNIQLQMVITHDEQLIQSHVRSKLPPVDGLPAGATAGATAIPTPVMAATHPPTVGSTLLSGVAGNIVSPSPISGWPRTYFPRQCCFQAPGKFRYFSRSLQLLVELNLLQKRRFSPMRQCLPQQQASVIPRHHQPLLDQPTRMLLSQGLRLAPDQL